MRLLIPLLGIGLIFTSSASAQEAPAWIDEPGKHLDLDVKGKLVRWVYEPLDSERREETYKPFLHVFTTDGESFLTKGPGGKFTHHRGIYFGFSKCQWTDKDGKKQSVDTWHSKGGYQIHREIIKKEANASGGTLVAKIDWMQDGKDQAFITEEREMAISNDDGAILVRFRSTLSTDLDSVKLAGDPQHAGFQFRASNEVFEKTAKQTYYIRPESGKAEMGATINWDQKKPVESDADLTLTNLPWKAMSFVVGEKRYTALYVDSPNNPKPARHSERDYGRFGSYFESEVTKEKPLTVNYALRIQKGEMTLEECEAKAAELQP